MSESLLQWAAPAMFPPNASFATPDQRGITPVRDFDATVNELIYCIGEMPYAYNNAAFSVTANYSMSADHDPAHHIILLAAFARIGHEIQDIDSLVFEADQSITDHIPDQCGHCHKVTIPFTNAQADDVQAGEMFCLRITRNSTDAGDDSSGDLELELVSVIQ